MFDSTDSDDSIPLPEFSQINISSKSLKRKSIADLMNEAAYLTEECVNGTAAKQKADEEMASLIVEDSLHPESNDSQPPEHSPMEDILEKKLNLFFVHSKFLFFSLTNCVYIVNNIDRTKFENSFRTLKPSTLEHVMSSILPIFNSNSEIEASLTEPKAFIFFLLKTLAVHEQEDTVQGCENILRNYIRHQGGIKFSSEEIFTVLFNYGVDIDSWESLDSLPGELKKPSLLNNFKNTIPENWMENFKSVLIILEEMILSYFILSEELPEIIKYLLFAYLDTNIREEYCISNQIKQCIAVALEAIPDETWQSSFSTVFSFVMKIGKSFDPSNWCLIVKVIPVYSTRGSILQKAIAINSLKSLFGFPDEEMQPSAKYTVSDLEKIFNPDIEEFSRLGITLKTLETMGVNRSTAVTMIDLCVNHLEMISIEEKNTLLIFLQKWRRIMKSKFKLDSHSSSRDFDLQQNFCDNITRIESILQMSRNLVRDVPFIKAKFTNQAACSSEWNSESSAEEEPSDIKQEVPSPNKLHSLPFIEKNSAREKVIGYNTSKLVHTDPVVTNQATCSSEWNSESSAEVEPSDIKQEVPSPNKLHSPPFIEKNSVKKKVIGYNTSKLDHADPVVTDQATCSSVWNSESSAGVEPSDIIKQEVPSPNKLLSPYLIENSKNRVTKETTTSSLASNLNDQEHQITPEQIVAQKKCSQSTMLTETEKVLSPVCSSISSNQANNGVEKVQNSFPSEETAFESNILKQTPLCIENQFPADNLFAETYKKRSDHSAFPPNANINFAVSYDKEGIVSLSTNIQFSSLTENFVKQNSNICSANTELSKSGSINVTQQISASLPSEQPSLGFNSEEKLLNKLENSNISLSHITAPRQVTEKSIFNNGFGKANLEATSANSNFPGCLEKDLNIFMIDSEVVALDDNLNEEFLKQISEAPVFSNKLVHSAFSSPHSELNQSAKKKPDVNFDNVAKETHQEIIQLNSNEIIVLSGSSDDEEDDEIEILQVQRGRRNENKRTIEKTKAQKVIPCKRAKLNPGKDLEKVNTSMAPCTSNKEPKVITKSESSVTKSLYQMFNPDLLHLTTKKSSPPKPKPKEDIVEISSDDECEIIHDDGVITID